MPPSFEKKWGGLTLKFDRTSIIATVIFIAFAIGYDRYMKSKYPHLDAPTPPSPTSPLPTPPTPAPAPAPAPKLTTPQAAQPLPSPPTISWSDEDVTFENNEALWKVDPQGGGFSKVELKNYRISSERDAAWVNLSEEALWLQPLTTGETLQPRPWKVESTENSSLTLIRSTQNMEIRQTFTFPEEGYGVDWLISYRNLTTQTLSLHAIVAMEDALLPVEQTSSFWLPGFPMGRPALTSVTEEGVSHRDSEKACEQEPNIVEESPAAFVKLIGLDSYYFMKAILPTQTQTAKNQGSRGYYSLQKTNLGAGRGCRFSVYFGQNFGFLTPNSQVEIPFKLFFGPKDYRITQAHSPALTDTINLGWLSFLSLPLLYILHLFFDLTNNYGLAIILLTLMIKVLFYPLTKSSAISMHKNRKLQPEIKELRERYAKDPRRQQQELMALMARHGTNPFKGCFPILLQMPVFFALYRVLSTAVELRHAPFFGWIQDLSAADPYFITPILMAACMVLQQRISAPQIAMDEMQQKVLKWLPLVFALMMVGFPSGMVLYMLINTIASIVQQYYLNRRFGLNK